jgi:hypothetical protein
VSGRPSRVVMLVLRKDIKRGIVGMAELTCTVAYRRSGFLAVNRTRACPYLTGKVFLVIWVVWELASRTLARHSRAKTLRDTQGPWPGLDNNGWLTTRGLIWWHPDL